MSEDIAKTALESFKRDKEHWDDIYQNAKDDLHFLSDDPCAQWDDTDYQERTSAGRPALTIDQLSQFVHQVANDIRQNTPTFTVIPDDQESSEDDAEAFRAIIRGIEYKSNADDVYDTAALNSVKSSIGFIRIDHDYADDEGFDQELVIKRVVNPLACFLDSTSIECDGRDAMHGTILDKVKVSKFKADYPDKPVSSFDPQGTDASKLGNDDEIIIAEHFRIVEQTKDITVDGLGHVIDWKKGMPSSAPKRTVKIRKVMRYKLSGTDVLEETTFPGSYIPLIPVYGEEHWQEGVRHLFSLIRKAKGAQRMYNVMKSLETEVLMKQPQAPVMAPEGSVEDYADDWKNPNKTMVLRYKTEKDGQPLPPPQRLSPPTMPTGFTQASLESREDIKASMGLYNAAIGMRGSATSGKQEIAQQQEGDVATFHFYDNLVRSITHVYRVLICAIPEIYDTPRVLRAIGKEEEPQKIGVNGLVADDQTTTIDLKKGKYTVRVVPGASYTTKRQEAQAFYAEIVTKQPELMTVMGDLLFKYSDMAGAEAMSERMKKVIDPKFLEEDKEKPFDPEKEQMAQTIQQLQTAMAELQQIAQDKQNDMLKLQIDNKKVDVEADYKDRDIEIRERELELEENKALAAHNEKMAQIKADVLKAKLDAKSKASPEMGMSDPDFYEEGEIPPIVQMLNDIATMTSSGLQQLAEQQAQIAQTQEQNAASILQAVTSPRVTEVIRGPDGRIQSGVSTVQVN